MLQPIDLCHLDLLSESEQHARRLLEGALLQHSQLPVHCLEVSVYWEIPAVLSLLAKLLNAQHIRPEAVVEQVQSVLQEICELEKRQPSPVRVSPLG